MLGCLVGLLLFFFTDAYKPLLFIAFIAAKIFLVHVFRLRKICTFYIAHKFSQNRLYCGGMSYEYGGISVLPNIF